MSDRGDRQYNNSWRILWTFHSKLDGSCVMFLYGCTLLVLTALYSLLDRHSLWVKVYIEMEAEQTISYILHTQKEYFLDRQTFTRQLEKLEMDVKTEDYSYRVLFPSQPIQTQPSLISKTDDLPAIVTIAHPQYENLSVYIGIVQMTLDSTTTDSLARSNICRSKSSVSAVNAKANIDFSFSDLTCPANFDDL